MKHFDTIFNLHQHISTTVCEIKDHAVVVEKDGNRMELSDIDTVVLAAGAKGNVSLLEEARGIVSEVYVVGDAEHPDDLVKAIRRGFETALAI